MKNLRTDGSHIKVENGTITSCEFIDSGSFTPQANRLCLGEEMTGLPPFSRMVLNLKPTPKSNLNMELWLPAPDVWNGRFLATGNGGPGGVIYYYMLQLGIQRGFATANIDLGTLPSANDISVIESPEKWDDFGNRGTHVMAEVSKSIIEQYYGRPARYSYFLGGSTGGQQALVEVQRYPDGFNGVIAVAPAGDRTHISAEFLWNLRAMETGDGTPMFTEEDTARIARTVIEKYRVQCGGAPGICS